MKSIALKITIVLVSSLLFATQANAYEIATPVNPTGNAWTWGTSGVQWNTTFSAPPDKAPYYTNQQTTGNAIFITKNGASSSNFFGKFVLNSVKSSNPVTYKKGNYYSTIINFSIQTGNQSAIGISMPAINRINLPNNAPYKIMAISSSYVPCANAGTVEGYCAYGMVSWNIIAQATRNDVGVFQLGLPNTDMIEYVLVQSQNTTNYGTIYLQEITEFEAIKGADTVNQQQQEAGEQAQSDGNTASNQAQSDATNTGTSLISGASNIIGALTDTTAGTCNINMNMGILDLGTQNFCQGDIGPIRPIIATITNVLFAFVSLRVFIFLIGVMFGLFDQFLGTKTETGGTNG